MTKREFIIQYILNSAQGAGHRALNVEGAIREAERAWSKLQEVAD